MLISVFGTSRLVAAQCIIGRKWEEADTRDAAALTDPDAFDPITELVRARGMIC